MTLPLPNIIDLTFKQLQQAMEVMGEPSFRASQIHQWLFSHHASSFDDMTILSRTLRQKLSETYVIKQVQVIDRQECFEEACLNPTEKILLKLPDNEMIESVVIASANRMTACVSSRLRLLNPNFGTRRDNGICPPSNQSLNL